MPCSRQRLERAQDREQRVPNAAYLSLLARQPMSAKTGLPAVTRPNPAHQCPRAGGGARVSEQAGEGAAANHMRLARCSCLQRPEPGRVVLEPGRRAATAMGQREATAAAAAGAAASAPRRPQLRTCRRCKQQFDPSDNPPSACRYHSALWTGGELSKACARASHAWAARAYDLLRAPPAPPLPQPPRLNPLPHTSHTTPGHWLLSGEQRTRAPAAQRDGPHGAAAVRGRRAVPPDGGVKSARHAARASQPRRVHLRADSGTAAAPRRRARLGAALHGTSPLTTLKTRDSAPWGVWGGERLHCAQELSLGSLAARPRWRRVTTPSPTRPAPRHPAAPPGMQAGTPSVGARAPGVFSTPPTIVVPGPSRGGGGHGCLSPPTRPPCPAPAPSSPPLPGTMQAAMVCGPKVAVARPTVAFSKPARQVRWRALQPDAYPTGPGGPAPRACVAAGGGMRSAGEGRRRATADPALPQARGVASLKVMAYKVTLKTPTGEQVRGRRGGSRLATGQRRMRPHSPPPAPCQPTRDRVPADHRVRRFYLHPGRRGGGR